MKIVTNKEHYDYFIKNHDYSDCNIVGWSSKKKQIDRFIKLAKIWEDDRNYMQYGFSILDCGCGVAHILDGGIIPMAKNYTGIDSHENMIDLAKKHHPLSAATFLKSDIQDYKIRHDYIISSGAFNLRNKDNYSDLIKNIKHMYDLCNRGVGINLLSCDTNKEKKDMLFYYDPVRVMHELMKISKSLVIDTFYLGGDDFSVFLYKDD